MLILIVRSTTTLTFAFAFALAFLGSPAIFGPRRVRGQAKVALVAPVRASWAAPRATASLVSRAKNIAFPIVGVIPSIILSGKVGVMCNRRALGFLNRVKTASAAMDDGTAQSALQ